MPNIRDSWNTEFIKSFKDFFAFAEWDKRRHTEAELKAVYKDATGNDPDAAPAKEDATATVSAEGKK